MRKDVAVADEQGGRHAAAPEDAKASEGISEFLGKVLDQLSISAWFPAVMLVGNTAILASLSSMETFNIGAAVQNLIAMPPGILVVIFFALILATIVIQAFQFETIRLFEGYWKPGRVRSTWARICTRRQAWVRSRRYSAHDRQVLRSAQLACRRLISDNSSIDLIRQLQATMGPGKSTAQAAEDLLEADEEFRWSDFCPAAEINRLESLEKVLQLYPSGDNKLLPTTLGNTLRSYEDRLQNVGGELENFMLLNYDQISKQLQLQHDQFRNRLDMYCSLVFVFIILAVAGPLSLIRFSDAYHLASIVAFALYAILGVVGYRAAIASARGYGSTLLAVDERLRPIDTPSDRDSSDT